MARTPSAPSPQHHDGVDGLDEVPQTGFHRANEILRSFYDSFMGQAEPWDAAPDILPDELSWEELERRFIRHEQLRIASPGQAVALEAEPTYSLPTDGPNGDAQVFEQRWARLA